MLNKIINECYNKKINLIVVGKSGVGKTSMIYAFAEEYAKNNNKELKIWHRLSEEEKKKLSEEKDLSRYFIIVDIKLQSSDVSKFSMFILNKNGEAEELISDDLKIFTNPTAEGILLFDEINMASPSVQSILFEIFLNKKISQYKLSDKVIIVGTGNKINQNIASNPIPKPLINRVLFIDFDNIISAEDYLNEWINWAVLNNIDKRIISFVKLYGYEVIYEETEEEFEQITTPRSWELVNKFIYDKENIEEIKYFIYGLLSKKVANKFITYLTLISKVNLDVYLKDNNKFADAKIDEKFAVIYLLSKLYNKKDKKDVTNFIKYLANNFSEMATILFLINKNDKEFVKFLFTNLDKDVLTKIGKYIEI